MSPVMPYGILYLAAYIENAGYEVEVFDSNIDTRQPEDFCVSPPQIIGFSVLTGRSIATAIQYSQKFKELVPKAQIVWGGIHPSLLPEQTLREPFIDFVVVGEGEITFLEFLDAIQYKKSIKSIKGLWYKDKGSVVPGEVRPFIDDLDLLPDPAWHLIDVSKYHEITLNTSRGCPFRCRFCYNQAYNQGRRQELSAGKIVAQVKHLISHFGAKRIKFFEDNFTMNQRRVEDFCNLLLKEKISIAWECEGRAHLHESLIQLMGKAGCYAMGIGVESGSQRILDFIEKGITTKDVETICAQLAHNKIGPKIYLMAGLPTETIEDFKQTVALAKRVEYLGMELMAYRPYPGTQLFDYCVEHRLFSSPKTLAEWVNHAELYDVDAMYGDMPLAYLKEQMEIFKKAYPWQSVKYRIRHDTLRLFRDLFSFRRWKSFFAGFSPTTTCQGASSERK